MSGRAVSGQPGTLENRGLSRIRRQHGPPLGRVAQIFIRLEQGHHSISQSVNRLRASGSHPPGAAIIADNLKHSPRTPAKKTLTKHLSLSNTEIRLDQTATTHSMVSDIGFHRPRPGNHAAWSRSSSDLPPEFYAIVSKRATPDCPCTRPFSIIGNTAHTIPNRWNFRPRFRHRR